MLVLKEEKLKISYMRNNHLLSTSSQHFFFFQCVTVGFKERILMKCLSNSMVQTYRESVIFGCDCCLGDNVYFHLLFLDLVSVIPAEPCIQSSSAILVSSFGLLCH